MQNPILLLSISILILLQFPVASSAQSKHDFDMLQRNFVNPPDSIRPYVYWYWINDHISPAGIIKDLEAMKEVGIGGAFIGNIGLAREEGTSYGDVKLFSDDWWKATETAMETASKTGITLGMFNSPGWSQSGGPWITPDLSMRYVSNKSYVVDGGREVSFPVTISHPDTTHLFTIAVPAPKYGDFDISMYNPVLSTTAKVADISNLMDGALSTISMAPSGVSSYPVDIGFSEEVTARSLVLHPAEFPFSAEAQLQAEQNGKMATVKHFTINRINPSKQVGFVPYAPLAISFEAIRSRKFRIVFSNIEGQLGFKELQLSPAVHLEAYMEKQLAKMHHTPLPLWHEYQWQTQPETDKNGLVIDPHKVINITSYVNQDGILTWQAPVGKWKIIHYRLATTGVTNSPASPEGKGLEVDKMDHRKLQGHFDAFIGKVLSRIAPERRTTFKYLVADSYEMGSQNWTEELQQKFASVYGYDPLPWMPVLAGHVVGTADQSDRFLWDLRRLVADLIATEYVGGLRKIGNEHGLKLWLENYGHWGFPSEFLLYGGQSDEVAGEFWNEGDLGNIENKSASSAAHIYGKNRVWAESFTAGGGEYSRYPGLLKKRGDWSFTEGVNQTLLHLYIHQSDEDVYPGLNAWFSTEFNRKNTWFYQGKAFVDYLRRSNFMLQQGKPVNDVAYFIGEDAPKMTGVRDPELPLGYDYDYINADVILNRLWVEEGKLCLPGGISYRMLVLPPLKTMRPELLQKIESLVKDGAVILGPAPVHSPSLQGYPESDKEVKQLADALWGGATLKTGIRKYGKGFVMEGIQVQEGLDYIGCLPDFKTNTEEKVLYVHRYMKDQEIYFVTNQSDHKIEFEGSFRINKGVPYWFDAVTGSFRHLPVYKRDSSYIKIPFKLDIHQSGFVVFDKTVDKIKTKATENFPVPKPLLVLNGSWQVDFLNSSISGGPDQVVFDHLISWPEHSDPRIKHFSGSAVYKQKFNIPKVSKNETIFLNTGNIEGLAKVTINGKEIGFVWTAPWQIDISRAIQKGENIVEIEVVSTWVNRLIGDSQLDPEDRITHTDVNNLTPDSSIYDQSGLLGPVVIKTVKYD